MNEKGEIDAARYPNFAALAGDGTWFRNATTVHEHTTEAVPAIMSGTDPQQDRLPLLNDHPDNVFTFLGAAPYAMNVLEPVTQLCPSNFCPRASDSFMERMTFAESTTSPSSTATSSCRTGSRTGSRRHRDVAGLRQGARGRGSGRGAIPVQNDADIDEQVGRQLWQDQRFQTEQYVDVDRAGDETDALLRPLMLPHSPWRFLPSGRQYGDALGIDGIADDSLGRRRVPRGAGVPAAPPPDRARGQAAR